MKNDDEKAFGFYMLVINDHLCQEKSIVAKGVGGDEATVIGPSLNYKLLLEE